MSDRWKAFLPELGLLLLAALALFLNAGVFEIDPYTEFFHLEAAKESLAAGRFWTPVIQGHPDLYHPPLWTWLTMLAFRLLGTEVWAARLPALLSALAGIGMTAMLAMELSKSRITALLAAGVLATTWGYFHLGSLSTPDILATLLEVAFLWAFLRWLALVRRKNVLPLEIQSFALLMGGLLGLLFLAQGTMGVLTTLLIALIYPLVCGERLPLEKLPLRLVLWPACLIPFPWLFVASVQNGDPLFIFKFVFLFPFERLTGQGPWSILHRDGWFQLRRLLVDLLPYLPFLPLALPDTGLLPRRSASPLSHRHRWLLWLFVWFALGLLVQSASVFQTPSLMLPFYPSFAILVGHVLGHMVETPAETRKTSYNIALPVCLAELMIGAVIYTTLIFQVVPNTYVLDTWRFPGQAVLDTLSLGPLHLKLGEDAFPLWKLWFLPGALIPILGGWALFTLQTERRQSAVPATLIVVSWLLLVFYKGIHGPILQHSASQTIAREINQTETTNAPILLYGLTPDIKRTLFYIDVNHLSSVRLIESPEPIRRDLRENRAFSGVMPERDFFQAVDGETRSRLQVRGAAWTWDPGRHYELLKFLLVRPPRFEQMQSGLIYFHSLPPFPSLSEPVIDASQAKPAKQKRRSVRRSH